jgi:hypothetical protein
MTAKHLREAILTAGIKNVNYFNGRLLTADDLRDDQKAVRERDRLYGQAIGDGIADGLEVSAVPGKIAVSITAGLAINRDGDTLHLPIDIPELDLTTSRSAAPDDAGLFDNCQAQSTGTTQSGGVLYLLTIGPASGYEGRAPVSGLNTSASVGAGCVSRYAVEGVSFNQIQLNAASLVATASPYHAHLLARLQAAEAGSPSAAVHLLRSLVAHLCFGTPEQWQFTHDPFRAEDGETVYDQWGALDRLRSLNLLCDNEVPLAILYRVPDAIRYVDNWSVRRRLTPTLAPPEWSMLDMQRRQVEGEAAFYQFQDQLEDIPADERPEANALDYFFFLPPVGIVPIQFQLRDKPDADAGGGVKARVGGSEGFAWFDHSEAERKRTAQAQAVPAAAMRFRRTANPFLRRRRQPSGNHFSELFFRDWVLPVNEALYASQLTWLIHQSTYYPAVDMNPDSDKAFRESQVGFGAQLVNAVLDSGVTAQDRQEFAVFWLNVIPVQLVQSELRLR